MNITRAGVLYYSVTTGTRGVQVAEVDFETGKTLVPPTAIAESDLYSHVQPDWSPDGKSLAFKTIDRRDQQTLSILSLDTGEIREIRPTLGIFNRLRWSPDGSFTVQSVGGTKRQGLYRVDPKTGEATPILVRPLEEGGASQASWMPDGRRLVYRRLANGAGSVHLLDVPAGTEREIVAAANLLGLSLSPDGKQITFVDRSSTESTLYVMPVEGGNRQALHKTNSPTLLVNYVDWTPDGKRIVFATNNADDNGPALWTISPSGGQPTRLELRIGNVAGALSPRIHPDGRRIAFGEGNRSTEIWALENFLPAAAK
jgi:Tol biopolymer transport system component